MVLGIYKAQVITSLENCIKDNLLDKSELEAKIVLMPLKYDDETQEDIDGLLMLLNPEV